MTDSKASNSLVILCLIAVTVVLYILKPLLIPFLIALMLSYILSPLVEKLATFRIPRVFTLLLVFLTGFWIAANLLTILVQNLIGFSSQIPEYNQQLQLMIEQYSADYPLIKDAMADATSFLLSLPFASFANVLVNSTLSYLSSLFLVLLFVAYLCLSARTYRGKIDRSFPGQQGKKILQVVAHINRDIRKYISIHTLISIATGISVWLACWYMQVPFAVLWGVLAFLLNYIPTIGSVLSTFPPLITAIVVLGVTPALWLGLLLVLIQIFWGNLVEPSIAGDILGISPLVILVSLVFWGWLWGVVGAILAVPIAVMVKVICANIPSLNPISVFMDDK